MHAVFVVAEVGAVDDPIVADALPGHGPVDAVRLDEEVLLRLLRVEAAFLVQDRDVVVVDVARGRREEEAGVDLLELVVLRHGLVVRCLRLGVVVPAAAVGHAREHVRLRQRDAIALALLVVQRRDCLGGRVVEDAVEAPHGQDVGVEQEDLLVLRLLEHAQFRHDVHPERVGDVEPIRYRNIVDDYHHRSVFSKPGSFALRDTLGGEDDEGYGGVGAGLRVVHQLVAHDARRVEIYVLVIIVPLLVLPIVRQEGHECVGGLRGFFFMFGRRRARSGNIRMRCCCWRRLGEHIGRLVRYRAGEIGEFGNGGEGGGGQKDVGNETEVDGHGEGERKERIRSRFSEMMKYVQNGVSLAIIIIQKMMLFTKYTKVESRGRKSVVLVKCREKGNLSS